MDVYFLNEGQLLDFENDNIEEEENADNMKLEGIDVAIWEKKNTL